MSNLLVFLEDTALVGPKADRIVWYMGKRCLGIVPIQNANYNMGATGQDMTVVQGFTENVEVRKMVGCRNSNRVVLLEVDSKNHRNFTEINCFDIDI